MLVAEDHFGDTISLRYRLNDNRIEQEPQTPLDRPRRSVLQFLRSAFLPEGYPDSVSEDYWDYQKWDSLQALCSSVTGLLSTQAVLKGVGVGESTATPAAAAIQWAVRDGTGMIGRIIFAYFQGSNLDSNAKTWRLAADVLNDLALTLELLSPMFPDFFLLLVCLGSLAKAVVGVAGGATRAALTQHQARRNNTADVSAKDGSQETAVGLIGMILGLILTPLVSGNQLAIWSLFFMFTFLHLFANYNAVSSVIFETLNQQRASMLISSYIRDYTRDSTRIPTLPTPQKISQRERIFLGKGVRLPLVFGSRIGNLNISVEHYKKAVSMFSKERYLIFSQDGAIHVILHKEAEPLDILKSYFHVEYLQFVLENQTTFNIRLSAGNSVDISYQFVKSHFDNFVDALSIRGWTTDYNLLGPSEWRSVWYDPSHNKFQ